MLRQHGGDLFRGSLSPGKARSVKAECRHQSTKYFPPSGNAGKTQTSISALPITAISFVPVMSIQGRVTFPNADSGVPSFDYLAHNESRGYSRVGERFLSPSSRLSADSLCRYAPNEWPDIPTLLRSASQQVHDLHLVPFI